MIERAPAPSPPAELLGHSLGPPAPPHPRAAVLDRVPARRQRPALAAPADPRRAGGFFHQPARADRHRLGDRLRARLPHRAGRGAPRRPYPRLLLLGRLRGDHRPAERAAGRAARLDRPARLLRLLPRRRLHDHRELAERARHQREPRHHLCRLSHGHLRRHHRRPARRRRRRPADRDLVHARRHPVLPRRAADGLVHRRLAAPAHAGAPRPEKALSQLAGRLRHGDCWSASSTAPSARSPPCSARGSASPPRRSR